MPELSNCFLGVLLSWKVLVSFQRFGYELLKLFITVFSRSDTAATLMWGNLSVKLFLAADPEDTRRILTIFLSAACYFRLFRTAGIRGCCSVTSRIPSVTDIECFALVATVKRSHNSSHYVLGAVSDESQKVGNPETAVAPPEVDTSLLDHNSRSAMLESSMKLMS